MTVVAVEDARAPWARVDLDEVCARWRLALDAVREAIRSSARVAPAALVGSELHALAVDVAHERADVSNLLAAVARDEHTSLRRPLDAPAATNRQLGLAPTITGCVFDLDGVLTASADLHAAAWAETFDAFLAARLERASQHFSHYARFSRRADYDEYVHARPRLDGVRAFLASRGITVPEGKPTDAAGVETVHGLANRKNEVLLRRLRDEGVAAFAGSRWYLEAAHEAGLGRAVVSNSSNTEAILERAALADLVDVCIDGRVIYAARLRPKPEPDTILAACAALDVEPSFAAVFETTVAGVVAASAADVAFVVGVDRAGHGEALRVAGADAVVTDIAELLGPDLRG